MRRKVVFSLAKGILLTALSLFLVACSSGLPGRETEADSRTENANPSGPSSEKNPDTDPGTLPGTEPDSTPVPPETEPPVTEAPETEPVTEAPATDPPATEAPVTNPPVTDPPATKPPVTNPPATDPPATQAPVTMPVDPIPAESMPAVTDADFGAVGDGATDDTAAFVKAIASLGNGKKMLRIPKGKYVIGGEFTLPADVTLHFDKGAALSVTGKVTLNGRIEAFEEQIFFGSGTYTGNSPSEAPIQWFGVSGGNITNSLQRAVDVFAVVRLNAGTVTYKCAGVVIRKPTVIEGVGAMRVNIARTAASEHLFIIRSGGVTIRNLYIQGQGTPHADTAVFYFDTDECDIRGVKIDTVSGISNGYFVKDAGSGTHTVSDFTMDRCVFTMSYNTSICVTDFRDGLIFRDVVADNVPGTVKVVFPGWYLENVTGAFMDNIDAAGGLGKGNLETGHGFVFVNCSNVRIVRGMQDYVSGVGLRVIGCHDLFFSNFVCSLFENSGIYMENTTNSTFEVIKVNGIYPAIKLKDTNGVVFEAVRLVGCSDLTFNSLALECNQTDGLILEDCHGITVNSFVFNNNNGNALIECGDSDGNILKGVVMSSNYVSRPSLTLVGPASEIRGAVLNGNVLGDLKGPGVLSQS